MSALISGILIFAGKELLSPGRQLASHTQVTKSSSLVSSPEEIAPDNAAPFKNSTLLHPSLIPTFNEKLESPMSEQSSEPVTFIESRAAVSYLPTVDQQPGTPQGNIKSLSSISLLPAIDNLEPSPITMNTPDQVNYTRNSIEEAAQILALKNYNKEDKKQLDWLQDHATQHLAPVKQHKTNWQIYFSPTVNYRTLSGGNVADSRSTVQNVPISLIHYGSANDFVDHTPAVGYEIGGSLLYRLTRNLSLKAGLQFNYSSYFIRAYSSTPELATITLNPYYGYYADSITAYTSVRNFSGKNRENLQNRYYELSVPIGLEMRVLGNGKLQFNIAGTIQPSYLLNSNNYLLSTDYAYYTKEPSLFRRWNVNGGLEAFVSYQIGGLRWQIGPQFRYQFLSTYTGNYPLKENLMEYGIKIGISKVIR
jgi:outer membrane protein with beta-barrel domain